MKKLSSMSYFRDLGGIKTEDGKTVKKDILFRCCDFSKISSNDEAVLRERITACIDLRADDEIKIKPDVFINEDFYRHLPLLSNEDNPAVTKETRVAILKQRMSEPGGMKGHITEIYVKMVNTELSLKNLRNIFDILLNTKEDGLVAYHCTQGKDRTGFVSACILLALGVNKEDVINDYLKFNNYGRFKRYMIKVGMSLWQFSFKTARELNAALVARKKYINAAFDEMVRIYGSISGFIQNGIGLSDKEIKQLRKLYLVEA